MGDVNNVGAAKEKFYDVQTLLPLKDRYLHLTKKNKTWFTSNRVLQYQIAKLSWSYSASLSKKLEKRLLYKITKR